MTISEKTSIAEAAARLTQPFTHVVIGQVDDYCAELEVQDANGRVYAGDNARNL